MTAAHGLSPERLDLTRRHLQCYIDDGRLAGTLTLVARHGEVAFCQPQGRADIERDRPVTEDTIWRIYSMSKPITSVALMMLYEQGLFQLDDPVHRYIPEWKGLRVYQSGEHPNFITARTEAPMTVRDLLTHMSGLTYGFHFRDNVDAAYRKLGVGGSASGGTLRDMIETLAGLPLEFSPGTRWNYSVSTDVCGYLVEHLSGKRFDQFLQDEIFAPLGMIDSGFTVPPEKVGRFAANYSGKPGSLTLVDDPQNSEYTRERTFFSGGGGLVATISDYYRFCQMLLNGGTLDGHRILSRKTIDLMTTNHLPGNGDLTEHAMGGFSETRFAGTGFGLGFSVVLDPAKTQVTDSIGSYAWGGAASTAFWIDPVEDMVVVFMTQYMPSTTYNIRRELKATVYAALED